MLELENDNSGLDLVTTRFALASAAAKLIGPQHLESHVALIRNGYNALIDVLNAQDSTPLGLARDRLKQATDNALDEVRSTLRAD